MQMSFWYFRQLINPAFIKLKHIYLGRCYEISFIYCNKSITIDHKKEKIIWNDRLIDLLIDWLIFWLNYLFFSIKVNKVHDMVSKNIAKKGVLIYSFTDELHDVIIELSLDWLIDWLIDRLIDSLILWYFSYLRYCYSHFLFQDLQLAL